jgi:hypothetical protein
MPINRRDVPARSGYRHVIATIWWVSDRPFSATLRGSPYVIPSIGPARSRVVDEAMISPALAAAAILAALFTAIPKRSPVAWMTSPV